MTSNADKAGITTAYQFFYPLSHWHRRARPPDRKKNKSSQPEECRKTGLRATCRIVCGWSPANVTSVVICHQCHSSIRLHTFSFIPLVSHPRPLVPFLPVRPLVQVNAPAAHTYFFSLLFSHCVYSALMASTKALLSWE